MSATEQKPVWFITGCSSGFGRELATALLRKGYAVVVTARNISDVETLVNGYESHALVVPLDVTQPALVAQAMMAAMARFGRIDVLVNNAGVGYFGSVEETSLPEARRMFDINLWGLADVTRAALPHLRQRRNGTIVNLSSVGGLIGVPGLGFYNASKFAVEGLSEALSKEVTPLGIHVMLVEPGPFRTDWAGRSAKQAAHTIDDYDGTAKARIDAARAYSGKQPGNPILAAEAIILAVESNDPPLHLILGKAALTLARDKLVAMRRDIDQWETVSLSADFPDIKG